MGQFNNRQLATLLQDSTDFLARRKWLLAAAAAMLPGLQSAARADIVVWTDGQANGLWDNTSTNWNDISTSNPSATYADGDAVQFSDSGPSGTITVGNVTGTPAGVSPASVEFTHGTGASGNITLTGDAIQGAASLTLDAGYVGTVALSSANTYTGGTFINGGTLHGGTGSFASTNTFFLGGGTFNPSSGGSSTFVVGQSFEAMASTSSTFSMSANTVIPGAISSSAGATAATTTLNLTNSSGNNTMSLANLFGFSGTLEMNGLGTGTVRLNDGATNSPDGGSATAIFDLGASSATLQSFNGGGSGTGAFTNAIPLGALKGSGSTSFLKAASHSGSTVFAIGGLGLSTTYAGTIANSSNPLSLEIVGGALTLTGDNTYTNVSGQVGTTIVGGALYADNATSSTGTGGVLVAGKSAQGFGTLGGDGTVTNGTTVNTTTEGVASFAQGGHLAPGAAGTAGPTGTLTLIGVTLNDYSNLDMTLNGASTSIGDDLISTNNGNLTLSGNSLVQVNFAFDNGAPAIGSTYDLINYGTGTLSFVAGGSNPSVSGWAATGVPAGETATFSTPGNGQVDVTFNAVPEPATLGLLLLGSAGLLSRRRRV